MPKNGIIILVLVLVVAAALYFVFGLKNEQAPPSETADPNYVEYVDSINRVKLTHHKDWMVTSSTGFVKLIPKTMAADFQYMQIELWAQDSKIQQLKFDQANSAPVGDVVVRYVNQGTAPQTKTYMHWPATADRNVIFEVAPGVNMGSVDERIQKVVGSLKFDQ